MIEHRLIEKMLKIVEKEIARIRRTRRVDVAFIDTAVDFILTYADRTHHGKEEDILFRDLERKDLSPQHTKDMHELVAEHILARNTVKDLVEARNRFAAGDESSLETIMQKLTALTEFYPQHIRKEDTAFFPNSEKYFTPGELNRMLEEFWEFDRKMVHEKYRNVVAVLEARAE